MERVLDKPQRLPARELAVRCCAHLPLAHAFNRLQPDRTLISGEILPPAAPARDPHRKTSPQACYLSRMLL